MRVVIQGNRRNVKDTDTGARFANVCLVTWISESLGVMNMIRLLRLSASIIVVVVIAGVLLDSGSTAPSQQQPFPKTIQNLPVWFSE